jgi:serine/threonine-protein kinase
MEPNAAPHPASIGRFRIDSVLGSGGMGAVYRAVDPTLQRTVALKTVRPDINRQDYLDRLYREAQACARLKHPNIVTVYEAGEVDGLVYMVMEYLEGQDLAKAMQRGGLTFEIKARILIQILEALQHAHDNHVIHRDIKPSNVYRQPDGSIKVVDFGLARLVQADAMTTGSGLMMGTAHYASPEQLKGLRTVDHRTDVYSTGVLAYELFAGRRPFQTEDDSAMSVMLRVMSDPVPPMNVALTNAFPQIERIVKRATEKSPDDRYQTAMEFRHELQALLSVSGEAIKQCERRLTGQDSMAGDAPTLTEPPPARRKAATSPSNKTLVGGVAVAAAAILTIGVIATRSQRNEPRPFPEPPGASAPAGALPAPAQRQPVDAPPPSPTSPLPTAAAQRPETVTVQKTASPSSTAAASNAPAPPPQAAAPPSEPDAQQLFIQANGSSTGLRYRLLKVANDGAEASVDPATATFKAKDKVRLTFESNIDGYLYVVQQGSSGKWTTLFPHPDINGGRNQIRRAEEYRVPSTADGWFEVDDTPGTDHIFVFLSKDPVDQLPGLTPVKQGYASADPAIIANLKRRIQSRDLIFRKDTTQSAQGGSTVKATYVVNRAEVGKAVAASFSLVHGQ